MYQPFVFFCGFMFGIVIDKINLFSVTLGGFVGFYISNKYNYTFIKDTINSTEKYVIGNIKSYLKTDKNNKNIDKNRDIDKNKNIDKNNNNIDKDKNNNNIDKDKIY